VGQIRTVLGDISPHDLGPTYCHEHLITSPGPRFLAAGSDMLLDDEEKSRRELDAFHSVGGRGLVEVSTAEFGRDASALRRLSAATGIHVVCSTGHVSEEYWRGVLPIDLGAVEGWEQEFESELTEGIGPEQVRAGVIKVGTSRDGPTEAEERILRAAGRVPAKTGAPITTHTTDGTAGREQIRILTDAGAQPSKICVGHLDQRLEWNAHMEIAQTGSFLGYDSISKEKYGSDERRLEFVSRLVDEGFGDRILLSGDMARRSYLESWRGGPGYKNIIETFVPALIARGLDEWAANALLVENPANFLAWT
jgi:5-phospho-D-xylono-1,4-lactonase